MTHLHDRFLSLLMSISWAFLCLAPYSTEGQGLGREAVVVQYEPERREARLRLSGEGEAQVGWRGRIQARSGPVDFRVATVLSDSEIRVFLEGPVRGDGIRPGDRALLFPPAENVLRDSQQSLDSIRRLLDTPPPPPPPETPLPAPDFLEEVTGAVMDDYEAWLLELESESLPAVQPSIEVLEEIEEEIPFYPDIQTSQYLRTGVDYDRFVFTATEEVDATVQTREQIGRYFHWDFLQEGDLWEGDYLRFENEFEANDIFVHEEADLYREIELPGGDRYWWRNRTLWRNYLNDQGDPFLLEDFEIRRIRPVSEEWERQIGLRGIYKKEYRTDSDDGYFRGSFLYEWNYRKDFDRWFDLSYEFTSETRNDPERAELDYLEHRIYWQYFRFEEDWSLDLYGDSYYRDYNQPGTEEDEVLSLFTGTLRRKMETEWTRGYRVRLEPRFYPTTEDLDSNAVGVQVSTFLEYSKEDGSLFLTLEPRVGQVFHFGHVPNDIVLSPGLPRDKSDGDFREAGLGLSLSWYPNERWRVNLFEDVYHRWFPEGETGETAFYLFDFPRIADSTSLFSSFSVDYLCSENLEISLRASHTKQIYSQYDENDTESLNVGIEALYRF